VPIFSRVRHAPFLHLLFSPLKPALRVSEGAHFSLMQDAERILSAMNLQSVPDTELLQRTQHLAREEQRIGIEVIHHLAEINTRKLFASLGYSSLFDYCTRELGYAEASAYRRISAMKLLNSVPEYESKLKEGAITVSNLSQVQSFLKQEERQNGKIYSKPEKLALLSQIEGKSYKQTERILAAISPQCAQPERQRAINEAETEIRFTAYQELMEMLERIKDLLAHKRESQSYAGLFKEMAKLTLKKLDPSLAPSQRKGAPEQKTGELASIPPKATSGTRYISPFVRRAVWKRDLGRCTYQHPTTGRGCESRRSLQFDHIRPFAMGGTPTSET
jgi:hypothetical protein